MPTRRRVLRHYLFAVLACPLFGVAAVLVLLQVQLDHSSATGVLMLLLGVPVAAAALDAAALGLRWIHALAGAAAAAGATFVVLFVWLLIALSHANLG